ncbi:MAG: peptide chain release factor aRF-1 [Candidatus Thermoplasmatota archaeon]|nr:peptide chain release factor aRF-1 [Candidatus Thermoplasmatota archaeon]|tara:strand:+ start:4209 stop:5456 length:1248 start_codon:yes stop_codon:yes gene_type:complete
MSEDDEKQSRRLKLKFNLEELRKMKGNGTELVTVYLPPDRQISDVRQLLQNEHGQAANIKSKATKKNVQGAIESALSTLNNYKTAGERGLAIFVGAIIVGNNKTRMINVTVDDPPEEIQSVRYRCDSTFELDQLEEMLIERAAYGLFVIDRSESCYGIASGKKIHAQEYLPSQVPSKHGRGGQSAQRFERLIEEAAHNFFKKSAERACNYWLPMISDMKGIIIGGPGATKDYVVNGNYFHHEIQKKILPTRFDVGYSNESGLRELVENAGSIMEEIELDTERRIVDKFLMEIMKPYPKATYGEKMVKNALEQGAVNTLLLSENLRKQIVKLECNDCKNKWEVSINRTDPIPSCPSCGTDEENIKEISSKTLVEEMTELAARASGKTVLISTDTEEGATLYRGFGGIAAMLRYPMS